MHVYIYSWIHYYESDTVGTCHETISHGISVAVCIMVQDGCATNGMRWTRKRKCTACVECAHAHACVDKMRWSVCHNSLYLVPHKMNCSWFLFLNMMIESTQSYSNKRINVSGQSYTCCLAALIEARVAVRAFLPTQSTRKRIQHCALDIFSVFHVGIRCGDKQSTTPIFKILTPFWISFLMCESCVDWG